MSNVRLMMEKRMNKDCKVETIRKVFAVMPGLYDHMWVQSELVIVVKEGSNL